jgi:transcriptional regulator with XRE-family HTH domain
MTRVIAWRVANKMERQGMTKTRLAELMRVSRARIDRILGANGAVTVEARRRLACASARPDLKFGLCAVCCCSDTPKRSPSPGAAITSAR